MRALRLLTAYSNYSYMRILVVGPTTHKHISRSLLALLTIAYPGGYGLKATTGFILDFSRTCHESLPQPSGCYSEYPYNHYNVGQWQATGAGSMFALVCLSLGQCCRGLIFFFQDWSWVFKLQLILTQTKALLLLFRFLSFVANDLWAFWSKRLNFT